MKVLTQILCIGLGVSVISFLSSFSIDPDKRGEENSDSTRVLLFEPSVSAETDLSEFNYHQANYFFHAVVDEVWEMYLQIDPYEAWGGPINQLKLLYSEKNKFNEKEIDEGTILLIDLNLFKNIKIDALFQIVSIDNHKKEVQFCYAKGNVTHGLQKISFIEDGERCIIKHETWYKSNKQFRDKFLYRRFHEKCLDEYHNHIMSRLIMNSIDIELSVLDETLLF